VQRIIVRPSGPLTGEVTVAGAKNSVLKLMAASLLAEGTTVLRNVPHITDVACMSELLRSMGVAVDHQGDQLALTCPVDVEPVAAYELVEKMRASINVLGPLLGRLGRATVALPGGDDFGPRPVDMHLQGLEDLGATVKFAHGNLEVTADRLVGTTVSLSFPSVGATENVLTAAVLAEGETVIENAAREPEITDLSAFLNRMGADVAGAGSSTLRVRGVDQLSPVEHEVVPDRIEAATFLTAVGMAGGEITVRGARADHMDMLVLKLGEMGMRISPCAGGLWAMAPGRLTSADVSTLPYPGLATDYKPLLVAMLTVADGTGIVTENLFSGRFRYVDELIRMGADIRMDGHHAIVHGVAHLSGAPVRAHDIRAGAALVVAGLAAEGQTVVADAHHIERGYEHFAGKLRALGADVESDDGDDDMASGEG